VLALTTAAAAGTAIDALLNGRIGGKIVLRMD